MTSVSFNSCLLLITNLDKYEGLAYLKMTDYQKPKYLG